MGFLILLAKQNVTCKINLISLYSVNNKIFIDVAVDVLEQLKFDLSEFVYYLFFNFILWF